MPNQSDPTIQVSSATWQLHRSPGNQKFTPVFWYFVSCKKRFQIFSSTCFDPLWTLHFLIKKLILCFCSQSTPLLTPSLHDTANTHSTNLHSFNCFPTRQILVLESVVPVESGENSTSISTSFCELKWAPAWLMLQDKYVQDYVKHKNIIFRSDYCQIKQPSLVPFFLLIET